ncbi:MAG: major antigen-like [Acidobacteria bacterium]|nr:major antigen-like [Acidobacteriota bacterium]
MKNREFQLRVLCLMLALLLGAVSGIAGVSRTIQDEYKKEYENRAMFLRIPIYTERQLIYISGQNFRIDQGFGMPRFKVGDQLRVLVVDFGGDEIKVRLQGIATAGLVELGFKFDTSLQENFPNRAVFDRALRSTLTEGLKYADLEDAKRSFVRERFDRAVEEIAGSASVSRESVLKNIAPQVPAYQEALREIEGLRNRTQDLTDQLSDSQSENRKLEAETKAQQAELARMKTVSAALQEKIENYNSQLTKLGDEVQDARGSAQGYQRELASIQRSLNLRVDSTRDLGMQITELGQAMRKLQKDNESFVNQINSLRTNLDAQQSANARLVSDNEELKAGNRKLQNTISELTSKEDSLAKRYLDLRTQKDKLDDFARTINALRTEVVGESTQGGVHHGKTNVYLKNVLLGSLDWSMPAYLDHNESREGEAIFSTESIDYVRVSPDERHVLKTLGDKYRIRVDLASASGSISITSREKEAVREIGEREHASWRWTIQNSGTKDARLLLSARLINKDSNEILLLQQDRPVTSSNMVRQIRGYLQPIPLAAGIVIGFLLFGIVGVFRRPKNRVGRAQHPPAIVSEPHIKKKL